jgi:hypothetical protein
VAKDRTISLDGRLYEAPTKLIGEYVQLLYHVARPNQVEIFHKNTSYGLLMPVDLRINCTVKRQRDKDQLVSQEQSDKRYGTGKLSLSTVNEAQS